MSIRNGTSRSGRCEGDLTVEVEMAGRFAGIDWASEKHDVLVADQAGAELLSAPSRTTRRASRVVQDAGADGGRAGRDRATGWAAGRAAARCRAAGVGVASEQGRGCS